jgi:hypothetical protein
MTWQEMDTGDLLRIAAAYADFGYQGGYEAALEATTDVLGAADRAGYEVKRRTDTEQQGQGWADALRVERDKALDAATRWQAEAEAQRKIVRALRAEAGGLRSKIAEAERERDEAARSLYAPGSLGLALAQRDQAIKDRAEMVSALEAKEEAQRQEAGLFQKRISEADAKVARLTVSLNMANERRRQERDEAVSLGGALIAAEAARDAAYAAIRAAVTLRKWPLRFPSGVWVWSGGWETAPMDVQHRAAVNAAVERGPAGEPDPLRGERG